MEYCEDAGTCRHVGIARYFGDKGRPRCEWACDVCKEGRGAERRRREGLAEEEWVCSQRESPSFFQGLLDE